AEAAVMAVPRAAAGAGDGELPRQGETALRGLGFTAQQARQGLGAVGWGSQPSAPPALAAGPEALGREAWVRRTPSMCSIRPSPPARKYSIARFVRAPWPTTWVRRRFARTWAFCWRPPGAGESRSSTSCCAGHLAWARRHWPT